MRKKKIVLKPHMTKDQKEEETRRIQLVNSCLELTRKLWIMHPEWSFGELLTNIGYLTMLDADACHNPKGLDDGWLEQRLRYGIREY